MLPNFFVVGAQKSGTTSLHNYLVDHPDIYLPNQKETKFFVEDEKYAQGIEHYAAEFFSTRGVETAVGEIDPDYMYFENALQRMRLHLDLSTTKFIFVLRNPAGRAFSHYLMTYRRGIEPLSFEEAVEQESKRISQSYEANMHYSYVNRGFYLRQIERFLEHVDRSQMLVLLTDDLKKDPQQSLRTIFEFLGVAADFKPSNLDQEFHRATVPRNMTMLRRIIGGDTIEKHIIRLLIPSRRLREKLRTKLIQLNQTSKHEFTLAEETRKKLIEMFREENDRLGKFLGRDLSLWNK